MKTTLKEHPHNSHVKALPPFPGMQLSTVRHFTPAQAQAIFAGHDLPEKKYALIINTPGSAYPLTRVTRLPVVKGNACRFVAEYFSRA